MTTAFVVSGDERFWPKTHSAVTIDPYIKYIVSKTDSSYKKIICLPYNHETVPEQIKGIDYIWEVHDHFLSEICHTLNRESEFKHSLDFFRKSFGLGFYRLVTMSYEHFLSLEKGFDATRHEFSMLSEDSFQTPRDFEGCVSLFRDSDLGQEQLFACYCRTFGFNGPVKKADVKNHQRANDLPFRPNTLQVLRILTRKALSLTHPRLLVCESYFSTANFFILETCTLGRLREEPIPELLSPNPNHELRNAFFGSLRARDRFETFLVEVMKNAFPTNLLEGLLGNISSFRRYLVKYPRLKMIVNESMTSSTKACLFLATAKEYFSVSHLYNEHNFLRHIYKGVPFAKIEDLTDKYLSVGWSPKVKSRKFIPASSLFKFRIRRKRNPDIEILFVTAILFGRRHDLSPEYAWAGPSAQAYADFTRQFFDVLPREICKKIHYKPYPENLVKNWQVWDWSDQIGEKYSLFRSCPPLARAKELMSRSKLVVIDYQSTSHLEALLSDIPVIFFWNRKTMPLAEDWSDAYDELLEERICFDCPINAAKFINFINEDPQSWWSNQRVQLARKKFLSRFFQDPSVLRRHLCKIARST